MVGLLRQGTGGYAAGMQALQVGMTLSATILLILGQAGRDVLTRAAQLPKITP